jgi:cation transport ATPase
VGIDEGSRRSAAGGQTAVVEALVKQGHRVLMVGDGTNDAPR